MHHPEAHKAPVAPKLNALRAAVLGANDGIVSIAGLVFGIAGATASESAIVGAGIAGIVAGALSMAIGEYVSVSTSKDAEIALLAKEKRELKEYPEAEFNELVGLYEQKGLSKETATKVATELTKHDVFAAHVEAELKLTPGEHVSPIRAAVASASAFTLGAIIPLIAITLPPESIRIPVGAAAILISLAITGAWSARVSGARIWLPTIRTVIGGGIAMALTYGIGVLIGGSIPF